ncbi:hypothetical protein [Paenibacillus illinoisensis]|uniref:hypothetical protein n=1 Tax=Paenibacillus illinoisensis TaxID=59845 RepID=UPI0035C8D9EA
MDLVVGLVDQAVLVEFSDLRFLEALEVLEVHQVLPRSPEVEAVDRKVCSPLPGHHLHLFHSSRPSLYAVDPRAISGCLFRYTYIWPNRGPGFWMYPVFVGRNSVAGFRWTGFFWVYSGIDLQRISSFSCF